MADLQVLQRSRARRGLHRFALAACGFVLSACGMGNADAALETTAASGMPAAVAPTQPAPPAATAVAAPASSPYSGLPGAVPGTLKAADFDLGGEGVAYHDNVPGNAGGVYRTGEDVDIINDTTVGYVVNNFETGEWLTYTISVATAGQYAIDLRASSAFTNSAYHAEIDGRNVTGRITLPNTSSWTTFKWVGRKTVTLSAGTHALKIVSDQQYFNLSAIRFVTVPRSSPYAGTPFSMPGTQAAVKFDWGGEGAGYHDRTPGNAGGQFRTGEDVDIIVNSLTGGFVVNGFDTGEWLSYMVNVTATAAYTVELHASSAMANSAFHVEVDGSDVTGRIVVPNTGDWNAFQWVGKSGVQIASGAHTLHVVSDQQYFNLDSVRLTPTAAAPPPPPPPPPPPLPLPDPGALIFSCTFPLLATDCGFGEQSKVAGRATITTTARDGLTAVRLHTMPGDSDVFGSGTSERDDLSMSQAATDCYEGKEQWWAHSVLFPDDYVVPPAGSTWNWGVVLDFHHTGSTGQANFHVLSLPTGLVFRGFGGATVANGPGDPGYYEAPIGPVVKNVWYDFVYHVKWSSGSDGYFDAWVNGVKKLSHRGPTLYTGMGCYLKLANYHTPVGQPVSVIHDRVMRGTSAAAVSLTPLQ